MVCVTWDDDSRTIKIAILSVASNHEQLGAFQIYESYIFVFKFDDTERFTKIYLFSLVILYEHSDTEADKVATRVYGSFCTFYLHGVLFQWLANTFLTT